MHLATNVLWQGLLPAGTRVRRSFSFDSGAKGALNLWYRRCIDASLAKRHKLTDRFHGLSSHLELSRLSALCLEAKMLDIELMAHPVRPDEYRMLMSDSMSELLAQTPVCSMEQA